MVGLYLNIEISKYLSIMYSSSISVYVIKELIDSFISIPICIYIYHISIHVLYMHTTLILYCNIYSHTDTLIHYIFNARR